MRQPHQLRVFSKDPVFAAAARVMTSTLGMTVLGAHATGSNEASPAVLMNVDATCLDEAEAYVARHKPKDLVVCYDGTSKTAIDILQRFPSLRHLIANGTPRSEAELASVYDGRSPVVRTPEALLGSAAQVTRTSITQSAERSDLLALLLVEAGHFAAFPDFRNLIATAVWELVMNAMYSAPVDPATGLPRYAGVARDQEIVLEDHEAVDITIARDTASCAIGVTDPFGRLTKQRIVASLGTSRQGEGYKTRSGNTGAGVGLMMVLHSVSQISFFVTPGQRTDIVVVAYPSKRQREYMRQGPTINFYLD